MKAYRAEYWDQRYQNKQAGWDAQEVTTPIKEYIDQLEDKSLEILIPGCGNAHEAEYLLTKGFRNITILDYAPTVVEKLQEKYKDRKEIKITCQDFFQHTNQYDLVLEQTFFCALLPSQREDYAQHMHKIILPNGRLVGVLFNKHFGSNNPPFGGSLDEYKKLFQPYFQIQTMEKCYNSIPPRQDSEIFINLQNKS
ncbi:methyltransferase domain-containing protein [Weeksella virosa]|mgnify:CR=1 FL=1|uniref:Thiopurine S-methyltransferase n=1 Tax=Weeksella virosa (strain ATCC 43766 / DSM 16922 / JCM 21250 / CCUG 30538 / CDC 9751 / IAM 14551 / NBRC 16016 / NCTC 11634 / CL345/78) TaxID=865938 RepID=F0P069_WEEVC|nr:methyltransferase domain-containing protein [Weeksella virosa]ADX68429.1 thiopurine S-methyltransferase [Weeksella virosa DSM 16922]MDK7674605.1 methyltransferase domain-containing protein [Weeksella virosa]SUP54761.1 thiopurine S-methyltransferase [Weeksella virosa]VEH63916.1 thiopurine S-methyltransferase [Weeksella virosa]